MRSYKLSLSEAGIDLFLRCHGRVAGLTQDLVAYGTTLALAVKLLGQKDVQEIAADLEVSALAGLAGNRIYHVGAAQQLRHEAETMVARLDASGHVGSPPGKQAIYLAALWQLMVAENDALLRTYRDMRSE